MKRLCCLLVLAAAGCGPASSSGNRLGVSGPSAVQPPAPTIAAPAADGRPVVLAYESDLWRAFGDNVAAADATYTGHSVEFLVRGHIEKDGHGYYIAEWQTAGFGEGDGSPSVICRVVPADAPMLAKAKPQQAFRVRGVCLGRDDIPSAFQGYSVTVTDCRILALMSYRDGGFKEDQ